VCLGGQECGRVEVLWVERADVIAKVTRSATAEPSSVRLLPSNIQVLISFEFGPFASMPERAAEQPSIQELKPKTNSKSNEAPNLLFWYGRLQLPQNYILTSSRETLEGMVTDGGREGSQSELIARRRRQVNAIRVN
jgi:hypothetical protein